MKFLKFIIVTSTLVFIFTSNRSYACSFIIAGKDTTKDGSVILGFNNDWEDGQSFVRIEHVPSQADSYNSSFGF